MDRQLATKLSPFVLLVIASCGSSSSGGNGSTPSEDGGGTDGTVEGEDGQASSGQGGETSGGSESGSPGGSGSASGSSSGASSGASSGGGSGASSGSGSGSTADGGPTADNSVYQMHNHINRDGLFVDGALKETALMGKTLKIDPTFAGTVTGKMYASPLYVKDGVSHKGTFYVVTEANNVYALDEATGTNAIPSKSAGTAASSTGAGCGIISPIGITGTPAIDPTTRLMVFDAATGSSGGGIKTHTIHAWSIDDFTEKWSLDVSTLSDPTDGPFSPAVQNQRGAVLIVGGIAYVTYGGHWGDCGAYHGWVVGVPLAGGPSMAKAYATPSSQAGIWAPGGPSSDGTSIYATTGNGNNGGGWKGAFSILRFSAGPTFTAGAANYWHAVSDDTMNDKDLGGSGPLLIDNPAITPSKLIVQLGKDYDAYVVNRTNMGGESSPVAHASVMSDEISNIPAWATTAKGTFVAMVSNNGGGGVGCKTGSGNLVVITLSSTAQISVPWCANNQGGGSPSITSSDGTNDAMVWTVGTDVGPMGGPGSGQLHAWDLASGAPVVTGSDMVSGTRHFSVPIFVNGRAIVGADNRLYALKP